MGLGPPIRQPCVNYPSCFTGPVFQNYRPNLKRKLYRNATDLHSQNSGNPSTVDSITGKTLLTHLFATGSFNDGTHQCGDYAHNGCVGGHYNGANWSSSGTFCGPWSPLPPVNTYHVNDAILGITVTNGGSGYQNGDTMKVDGEEGQTCTDGHTKASVIVDRSGTFSITTVGGAITSAKLIDGGSYTGIGGNVLTAIITKATPASGHGAGATFAFTRQDAIQDFSSCNLTGWAAVASKRRWHGMFPFNNWEGVSTILNYCKIAVTDSNGNNPGDPGYVLTTVDNWEAYEPYLATPPSYKYLALQATATLSCSCTGGGCTCPAILNGTPSPSNGSWYETINSHIDRHSGEIVLDSFSTNSPSALIPTLEAMFSLDAEIAQFIGFVGVPGYEPTSISISSNGAISSDASGTLEDWLFDPASGHFHRYLYGRGTETGLVRKTDLFLSDDGSTSTYQLTYAWVQGAGGADPPYSTTLSVTGSLTQANGHVEIINDCESNFSAWNLLDRTQLPLSTSPWTGIIPLVTRNEVGHDVTIQLPLASPDGMMPDFRSWNTTTGTWNRMAWVDLNVWTFTTANGTFSNSGYTQSSPAANVPLVKLYDGSILGLPNTDASLTGGVPDFFYDANYLDLAQCDPNNPESWYQFGYGGYAYGYATQMVNDQDAAYLMPGRSRMYNASAPPSGGVWSVKYVESAVRLPSFDHARPYGSDRYLFDEQNVGCISTDPAFDGTTVYISGSITAPVGSRWLIVGSDGHNGVYTIASGSGPYVLTNIGGLPAWFTGYWDNGQDLLDTTQGVMIKQRFPNCAPFGGRIGVNSVTDNHDGTCTVVTAATPCLIDEAVPSGQTFPIDLCGLGMTPLATNLAVTTSSKTTFKVTASYATIAGAKWMTLYGGLPSDPDKSSVGVARWYWADSSGKGNFVLGEWANDYRTNGENARLTTGNSGGPILNCGGGGFCEGGYPGYTCTNPAYAPPTNYGYDVSHTTLADECNGFMSCASWLFVLSPNSGDTPVAGMGVRYEFSFTAPLDDRYGTKQNLDVMQAAVDPLFQLNHRTCGISAQPTDCIPYVEARAILPHATGAVLPPDNGAGAGQNETPPSGLYFKDYSMENVATHLPANGNYETPPAPNSQPTAVEIPTGIAPSC